MISDFIQRTYKVCLWHVVGTENKGICQKVIGSRCNGLAPAKFGTSKRKIRIIYYDTLKAQ